MKPKACKRPVAITILATTMIGTSIVLILDRLLNFYIYRILEGDTPLVDSNSINLQVVSGIAFLGFGIVPIFLAIGLWNLKSWARFLSICLYSSVMFPATAASFHWISPPSATKLLQIPNVFDDALSIDTKEPISRLMVLNPYIAIGSAIALAILLTPAIGNAFRSRYHPTNSEN
ncbi:hypothetical protein [Pseudanabaena sp. UWO310]|uniref:hypothetical protein n=1 Tax=Pseudanabaena sp. UWO310 TaxID=2480795 RepID=UPI00115A7840|nr:hypothetical protein [Pseudanabaena sp. UWO310]TYQ26044.1 hypothetical protein PseudUWO310_18050 [Pseudanabaena sp. UWO310]